MNNLVWQRRAQPGDDYALALINPDAVDFSHLKKLFAEVTRATGASGKKKLKADASTAFDRWLADTSQPLPFHAYARLSNWFLTQKENDRESALGARCAAMWDALFMTRPPKRLTRRDDNADIMEIAFLVWWSVQEKLQGQP